MFRRMNPAHLHVPAPDDCLPGRDVAVPVPSAHYVNGNPLSGPFPAGMETIVFGMGCFWGAERLFWQQEGVYTTAAVYAGGTTPNPTYEETCTGMTGHTEAVLVVYEPAKVELSQLLRIFWENHDPTQYMGQGNDIGTQYRSAIYTNSPQQLAAAQTSRDLYQSQLHEAGYGDITTEITPLGAFYYAEEYHQQYLAKNPGGYCNHGFCQVAFEPAPAQ
ncbi:MAG: peptide-methionine (S)-S-oxide reductase MsrA [Acidimicrobiia bacterium]|nr:peptide-methionine (S)-S-oxide reductase MsrA [Acidimicrobiia bacterium]